MNDDVSRQPIADEDDQTLIGKSESSSDNDSDTNHTINRDDDGIDPDATLNPFATLQFDSSRGQLFEHTPDRVTDDQTIDPVVANAVDSPIADVASDTSRQSGTAENRPDRFLKGRSHARGGLGEVFVALDAELNRQVALKQIQQQFATDEFSRSRFLFEAEITGRLEHPGVVPVYGMGMDAMGDPYYAMRFIEGMSLDRAIRNAHRKASSDPSSLSGSRLSRQTQDSDLDLRRLLNRFMDVCQTIGFAHSRDVIHRDIKPDNIMLGHYGETLVVDWGLARKLEQAERSKEQTKTKRSQKLIEGTPAFMSPEQAAGNLDCLTPASDIYSLGATLYCILTGHPAVTTIRRDGRRLSVHEVLKIVRQGEVPSPRIADPTIPKSLAAICTRAMAKQPADRYQTAQELATEVERWMADEPVDAYEESWLERSRRWVKRHQTLAASLLAIVMLSVIGLTVFSVVLRGKNTQLGNLAHSLSIKNEQLDQRSQELERINDALSISRNRADRKAAIATAVTEFLNKDVLAQASPLAQPEPDLKVRTVFRRATDALDVRFETQPAVKAELLHTVGVAFQYLDQLEEAEASLRESLSLRSDQLGADDSNTKRTKLELASVLIAQGKQNEIPNLLSSEFDRIEIREFITQVDDSSDEQRLLLSVLSDYHSTLEQWQKAEQFQRQLINHCQRHLGANHWSTLEAQTSLVAILENTGRFTAALDLARDVSQRSRDHLGSDHVISLAAELSLAQRLFYSQQTDEAFGIYDRVLDACQRNLGDEHAYTLYVRNDLAMLQSSAGNNVRAVETLRAIYQLTIEKVGPNHPDSLNGALNLAAVMLEIDASEEAASLIRDALRRCRQTLGDDHSLTGYARTCLADYHFRNDEFDQASELIEQTVAGDFNEKVAERKTRLTPLLFDAYLLAIELAIEKQNYEDAIERSTDVLNAFSTRGMISSGWASFAFGQLAIATVASDDINAARQKLDELVQQNSLGQRQQLRFRLGLIDALQQFERYDTADLELDQAFSTLSELAIESEEDCFLVAWAADVFGYSDRMIESLELYRQAIDGMAARWEPTHASLVTTMESYAWQLQWNDEIAEAAEVMQDVVDRRITSIGIDRSDTQNAIAFLGDLLHRDGQWAQAAEQFDRIESVDRLSDYDTDGQTDLLLSMAETYREVERFDQSVTHYMTVVDRRRTAIGKHHEDTLYTQHQLAYTFERAGQPDEAIQTYREVIQGRRAALGNAHSSTMLSTGNLLWILLAQERQSDAMQLIDEVTNVLDEMDEKTRHDIQRTIGDVSREFGELEQSRNAYQDVVRLTDAVMGPTHAQSWLARHQLAYVHSLLDEHQPAIDLYQQVVAGRSSTFGDTHQYTRLSLKNLAEVYIDAGQLDKAIESYTDLLSRAERVSGPNHQLTIDPRDHLANLHYEISDYQQAIDLLRQNLDIVDGLIETAEKNERIKSSAAFRKLLAAKANVQVIMADAAAHMKRWDMAMDVGKQALETLIAYQPNSWTRYRAMSVMGEVHVRRDAIQRGRDLLQQAFQGLSEATNEMTTKQSQRLRSECAERLAGAFEEGTEEQERWLSIRDELLGSVSPTN